MLGGCFLAKTVGVRPAEWQRVRSERGVKKKFIFFLSSFPERMFREVCGVLFHVHAARDQKKRERDVENLTMKNY
jgi:hypothetical protein